jgi:hypothetical protein
VITVKSAAAPAFFALNDILKKHNYRTRRADTGAYNCRKITGGRGYSLHAYGIAADLNWQSNPYSKRLITDMPMAMVQEIERLRTRSGHKVFRWGGRYKNNKDAMHYEVICTPAQLATGIVGGGGSHPSPAPKPEAKPEPTTQSKEAVDMYIAVVGVGFFAQVGNVTIPLDIDLAELGKILSNPNSAPLLTIPAKSAKDFIEKTTKQTVAASG